MAAAQNGSPFKELHFNNNAAWVLAATCGCSIRLYNGQFDIPEQRRWLTSPFQPHIASLLAYADFIQIPQLSYAFSLNESLNPPLRRILIIVIMNPQFK